MIKTIILDLDGTLYPRQLNGKVHPLTEETRRRTKQWIIDGTGIGIDEIDLRYKQLGKDFHHPYDGFKSLGLPIKSRKRRSDPDGKLGYFDILDTIPVEQYLKQDEKLAEMLKRLAAKAQLYITTLASPEQYSYNVQTSLGIHGLFHNTFCPYDLNENPENISKGPIYTMICRLQNCLPMEAVVVGDHFLNDLKPAEELGLKIVQVNSFESWQARQSSFPHTDIYGIEDLLNRL